MQKHNLVFATVWVAVSIATGAEAATDTLKLTGKVSDGVYSPYAIPGFGTFEVWGLPLDGLSPANEIMVSTGDSLNVTVNLNHAFKIPANPLTVFFLDIGGSSFPLPGSDIPGALALTTGTTSFVDGSAQFTTPTQTTGGLAALALGGSFAPGNTIKFDTAVLDYQIARLGHLNGPATLSNASLNILVLGGGSGFGGAVPEPATWTLMLLGLGGLGAALRSRRKSSGAFRRDAGLISGAFESPAHTARTAA